MTTSPFIWPKTYLLQIYDEALKQGFLLINDLDETQAASLRNSLNRVRRRSDKTNATYITPEHYLVTIGQYDASTRTMPVIYDKLPEGQVLPTFRSATESEVVAYQEKVITTLPETPTLDSGAIDDYVTRMQKAATKD